MKLFKKLPSRVYSIQYRYHSTHKLQTQVEHVYSLLSHTQVSRYERCEVYYIPVQTSPGQNPSNRKIMDGLTNIRYLTETWS